MGVSCCSRGSCDTSATPDTRFPRRTRCSTARCSRPTRGGRASDQEKCLLSGRLRVERNLDRHPAKRSRAVQGGPSGPSAASRAAPPLTARRSEATKCRSRTCPRRALQPPDASNYGHWAALWAFTDPREEQERRKWPRACVGDVPSARRQAGRVDYAAPRSRRSKDSSAVGAAASSSRPVSTASSAATSARLISTIHAKPAWGSARMRFQCVGEGLKACW